MRSITKDNPCPAMPSPGLLNRGEFLTTYLKEVFMNRKMFVARDLGGVIWLYVGDEPPVLTSDGKYYRPAEGSATTTLLLDHVDFKLDYTDGPVEVTLKELS